MNATLDIFRPKYSAPATTRLLTVAFVAAALISLIQLALPLAVSPVLVRGDGVGYYAWLRSAVIDGDLDFQNEFEYFEEALPESRLMSSDLLDGPRTATGLVPNHWPMGAALLWSPFYLAAHGVGNVLGLEADGYAVHYQLAVGLGSVAYGIAGLWLLFGISRRFFTTEASVLALLSVWGASSLTAYMYFMPAWSHAGSFFAVALLLKLWLRARESRQLIDLFWLAAVCGLAVIIRHQEIFFGLVLLVELAHIWRTSDERTRETVAAALVMGLGGLLAVAPQLIGWQILHGRPLPTSYAPGSEFNWWAPNILDVLLAPRVGLLTATPIIAIAIFGLPRLWQRNGVLASTFGAVFAMQIWLVASFVYFYGGQSFGPRYFVSALPLITLALASVYESLSGRLGPWPGRVLMTVLVGWNYLLLAVFGLGVVRRASLISWGELLGGVGTLLQRVIF